MGEIVMKEGALLEQLKRIPFDRVDEIDKSCIGYYQHVRDMCAMNTCGQYGRNWMCPPGVGELEVLRERYAAYPRALLYCLVQKLEDSFDVEGMDEGRRRFKELAGEADALLWKALGRGKYIQMGPGGCHICEQCTYPEGKPCRFPERAIPPMEGCGIDVVELCAKTGFRYHHGANTVTYFGLVLFGS